MVDISCGESVSLEFKKSTAEKDKACRTLCAFANGQGGDLIFGVTPSGKVVGQKVEVKLAIPQDGRRKFKGALIAIEDDMLVIEVDGKPYRLLMDNVDKANVVPVF